MKNHDAIDSDKVSGPVFFCCLAFLYVTSPVFAAGPLSMDKARAAYVEGRFLDVARIGENLKTSEGLALAAQSLSTHAYYIAKDDEKGPLLNVPSNWQKRRFSLPLITQMPICNWHKRSVDMPR